MTVEMCRRCGGCGAISKNDQVITCPKCNGKGYTELQPVIDAEQVQERQRAPYRFRNMTIREVPVKENPCTDFCQNREDCPGEVWACKEYSKFRRG